MSDEPTANTGEIVRRAVLHAVARSGRVNPAAIELECQGANDPDVAAAVRRLVADGLVERVADARGYVGVLHDLRLTSEGRGALSASGDIPGQAEEPSPPAIALGSSGG